MSVLRPVAILLTMAAVLCMTPGISALAAADRPSAQSCCKPTSACGTGLMAADCCRADQAPQADAPSLTPVTMTKKQLQAASQPAGAQFAGEGIAGASGLAAPERIDAQATARAPSTPLFLTYATLLI